ncbi:MAG: hypothetical protein GW772_11045 [Flavobacteriia bacterium]|nr:hypothetical protein [Flavobacteriia bacterium]OIP45536.1 MAG: hypothetical protein AUK46_11870 [Flavobacteriaceae bacterium CG2_30_31_66]PIV96790.1 MAG: hypothetical protein COW43_06480 [Flavobacteriaceae bacterium CG17_big_fil_post_rev_8_21_14_2_50_31_13]PIX11989.1 MAG: hypothetical protein COZ74_12460 [Flavobacteriaceae bacterium CG_4_8_14_3_um_filter_31_8]PIY14963.1 MAG: hypothetical protein COZ16_06685 [Flavobacteriaceae bacterium CG_4_10_14_3_um_filter_31_253]PIZ11655.1 MAG: hypotheti
MFKKFMITCDEATKICNKSQYNETSFFEQMQLSLHLLFCKFCALYTKQNRIMTEIFKMKAKTCKHHLLPISEKDKAILKKQFKELNN